ECPLERSPRSSRRVSDGSGAALVRIAPVHAAGTRRNDDCGWATHGRRKGAGSVGGSFAFVYSPRGEAFTVRMDAIKSREGVKSWWFDPRYGSAAAIYTGDNLSLQTFTPPGNGRSQDWVLVLDAVERKFPAPGQR
ncbi:MAG: putative collagen-binding domain-containing protein, partial [Blastocatellia bacterium]